MPTPALFLTFSFLLMIVEGVGSAMSYTASYSYLTRQYPEKKGRLLVSDYSPPPPPTIITIISVATFQSFTSMAPYYQFWFTDLN